MPRPLSPVARPLVPSARRWSQALVSGALAVSAVGGRLLLGRRAQDALTLTSLALGMPHGAADTELLRAASGGSRRRWLALTTGYGTLAAGATAIVRSGAPWVDHAALAASAAHFTEGELACWPPPPAGATRARLALRAAAAATTTVLLPAAVSQANRVPTQPEQVGVNGATVQGLGPRDRPGMLLLRAGHRGGLAVLTGAAMAGAGTLLLTGDRPAAIDTALLTALDVVAPPSLAFAAYFGGWHALRHTARVADTLTGRGLLPAQQSLPAATGTLARRSAWAAAVGVLVAGALAVRQPERASDNALAAVLGLTVPHMATVTAELSRPRWRS